MPTLTIPEKLLPLLQEKKRYKIVIGGRGSGKSHTVADLCLMDAQTKSMKIGCFREFQSSIEDSVHSLLGSEVGRLGLEGFNILRTEISSSTGGQFKFRGLSRNPDAMKSMEGFHRFWCEEGQTISKESLTLLTPTLRTEDSEIWMTANPNSRADPFSQRFILPFLRELERDGYYSDDMHLIIVCNYRDNPFFPAVLEQERQFDLANLSPEEYAHIWEGKFLDTVEGAIIRVAWFNAAIDAHLKLKYPPQGAVVVSHDPSDTGPDPAGLCVRHGSVILDVQEHIHGDAGDHMEWALEEAIDRRADVFRWDCDGLGVSLKRQVITALDGIGMDIAMFKGSESVESPEDIYQPTRGIDRANAKSNKQTFRNQRAQFYWTLRDRFLATYDAVVKGKYVAPEEMISISSKIECIDRFRSELCRIPKKYNANGLIQIMSKEDMKRLKPPIDSPNLADSAMMSMPVHSRAYAYQHQHKAVVVKQAGGWT